MSVNLLKPLEIEMTAMVPNDLSINQSSSSLVSKDLNDFLAKYFVNYDLLSRSFNLDFSQVKAHQLVLMGECHQSLTLQKVQNEFLNLFIDSPTKLFIEGLLPSIEMRNERLPYWKQLPDQLRIFGSDVRGVNEADFLEWSLIQQQRNERRLQNLKALRATYLKISGLIEKQISEGEITINKDHLFLPNHSFCGQWEKLLDQHHQENPSLSKTGQEIGEGEFYETRSSNQGLFDVINAERTSTTGVSRMMAIWGMVHFLDENFIDQLIKNKITYSILMPNAKLFDQIEEEYLGVYQNIPMDVLELRIKEVEAYLEIPKNFRTQLAPRIQALLKTNSSEQNLHFYPISFDTLTEKIKKNGRWTFAKDALYKITGINSTDFLDLLDFDESKMDPDSIKPTLLSYLISIFNQKLHAYNLYVKRLHFPGNIFIKSDFCPRTLETSVLIGSDQPFQFRVEIRMTQATKNSI
jgi:hypothetical protein